MSFNFIEKNWFKLGIVLIILLHLFGFFYFSYIKPTSIKKFCYESTEKNVGSNFASSNSKVDKFNTLYQLCLKKKGL